VRPYLKNPFTKKRAGGVAQGVSPEFKPQYCKKKKVLEKGKVGCWCFVGIEFQFCKTRRTLRWAVRHHKYA
jgi:hypothetical protein